jgi:hypothetical protein
VVTITFTHYSGEKIVRQFPDEASPFQVFRYFYEKEKKTEWKIDFNTVPDQLYKKWRFGDEYWKLFAALKKGMSVTVGTCLYKTNSQKHDDVAKMAFRVFGCIDGLMEMFGTTFQEYQFVQTNDIMTVIFMDLSTKIN